VQRHQAEKFASRDAGIYAQQQQAYEQQMAPQYAPAPVPAPAAPPPSPIEQLTQLADLKDRGILTEEEFAAQEAKLLAI